MRTSTRALALAALVVAFLVPAGMAVAQDYPEPDNTPDNPGVVNNNDDDDDNDSPRGDDDDDGDDGSVLPNDDEEPTGETPTGGPGGAETDTPDAGALPGSETAGAPGAAPVEAAPVSGSLPITGGDVAGLTAMGAAAIGIGAVLVRRSRRAAATVSA